MMTRLVGMDVSHNKELVTQAYGGRFQDRWVGSSRTFVLHQNEFQQVTLRLKGQKFQNTETTGIENMGQWVQDRRFTKEIRCCQRSREGTSKITPSVSSLGENMAAEEQSKKLLVYAVHNVVGKPGGKLKCTQFQEQEGKGTTNMPACTAHRHNGEVIERGLSNGVEKLVVWLSLALMSVPMMVIKQ